LYDADTRQLTLGQIERSYQLIMLGDCQRRINEMTNKTMQGPFNNLNLWMGNGGWPAAIHGSNRTSIDEPKLSDVSPRRMRSANMAFFDGHAESVAFRDLYENTGDLWGRRAS
jgi:prepilin-type processing-associated H-X9-DG protein